MMNGTMEVEAIITTCIITIPTTNQTETKEEVDHTNHIINMEKERGRGETLSQKINANIKTDGVERGGTLTTTISKEEVEQFR